MMKWAYASDVSSDLPAYFFSKATPLTELTRTAILLMLDFDGTLVPIMKNPADCYLSDEVRYLLTVLLRRKCTICIVSGRSLTDLRKRVDMQGVYYSGSHGLEIWGPDISFVHPQAKHGGKTVRLLKRSVLKEFGSFPGILIESKPFSFTLHYRMLPKKDVQSLLNRFKDLISRTSSSQEFLILAGKKVMEVMPRVEWDKGAAVKYIRDQTGGRVCPVYVGDDRTDESAFRALQQEGVTVRIGRKKNTAATYYLKNQNEIVRFLEFLSGNP